MPTTRSSHIRPALLAAGVLLSGIPASFGATYYYGSGDANWSANKWATSSGGPYTGTYGNVWSNSATFEGTSGTVSVDEAVLVSTVTLAGGYVLQTQGTNTLTLYSLLASTGNNSVTAPLAFGADTAITSDSGTLTLGGISAASRNLTLGGAGDIVVTGAITNSNVGLTKTGAGTATLQMANSYAGKTTISGGVLEVAVIADAGTNSGIGNPGAGHTEASNLMIDGGTLRYTGAGDASTNRLFTLTANNGGFDVASGAGALTFSNTGPVSYTGTNTANTLTLGASNSGDNTFNLSIGNNGSGATSVQKTGIGKWILTAVSTYTGSTIVSGGTLSLAGTGSIANSATTVQSGGTLAGTGTAGGVSLNSGAFLAPGSITTAGTLKAASLTWNAGGTLQFNLGATSDRLVLTGALTKSGSGAYLFDFLGSAPIIGDSYTLVSAAGGFSGFANDASDFSYTNLGAGLGGQFAISGNNLTFTVSAVPEPATYGLLGAGLLAGIAFVRRRRRLV